MRKRKNRRLGDRVLLCTSALLLALGCMGLSLFPAARFSATENRNLADFPSFSPSSLADGSYTAALDAYATERLPARLTLRQMRALCQLAEGKCEVGGVLLCRDGSLAKRITANERAFAQNLAAMQKINSFASANALPLTVAIAPRRIDARTEVLPSLYDTNENTAVWKQLQDSLPDAVTFPALTADAHWYRTDHHWTTAGAYAAYCALGEHLGFIPHGQEDFAIETVSNSFYGTTHAAAGIPLISPDSITLYRYENDDAFTLLIQGKRAPFTGFYDNGKLTTRDGYAVFFGGNYSTLEITDSADRETLLVIKDSFANAMLPFLARHYNIIAVDPRYTAEPLSAFADRADRILLLCGMQTLCESAVFRTLAAGHS